MSSRYFLALSFCYSSVYPSFFLVVILLRKGAAWQRLYMDCFTQVLPDFPILLFFPHTAALHFLYSETRCITKVTLAAESRHSVALPPIVLPYTLLWFPYPEKSQRNETERIYESRVENLWLSNQISHERKENNIQLDLITRMALETIERPMPVLSRHCRIRL